MGDQITEIMAQKMTLDTAKQPAAGACATGPVKKSSWRKDYSLPPCKVCGGEGSGVHYGINTCEACKGFFRRSLARKETYKCRQSQKCRLEAGKRNMCSSCRFKRCLDVGMSTEGIKIGRYTTEKRRQDTVEVKQLHAENAMASQRMNEAQREKQRTEIIETIVDAARRHFHNIELMHDDLSDLQKQIQQKSKTKENLLNTLEMMSSDEFNQYLQTIEPEPDEQTTLFQKCVRFLEDMIRKYIRFAKAVPGFKDLSMDDQIALVKASYNDVTMIYKYRFCQGDSEIQGGSEAKLSDGLPEDYRKLVLQMAAKFRSLELTEEEMQLVNALLLVSPDRCDLAEPERATAIQEDIVDSLQWLLKQNHDCHQMVFARLVSVLTEMRTFGEASRQMTRQCIRQHDTKHAIPPLVIEMMT